MANGIGGSLIRGFQAGEQSRAQALGRQREEAEIQRFTDRSNMESMLKGALEFQNITDPTQQDAYLKRRIAEIDARGGDPKDSIELLQTPHAQRMPIVQGLIGMGERFGVIKPLTKLMGKSVKPTANIQDFKHYQTLLKTDPENAEKFARQVGITEKEKKQIKPTSAQQNFEVYRAMPPGPEKEDFGRIIGIKPEETPGEALKREERIEKVQTEILGATTTIGLADQILTTPGYIDKLSGISGKIPSVPGSTAFDAEIVFNQLKNSLTLDNLNKMSGVLSDSDIKILQSAGAGLEFGMSKPAMTRRINVIKSILNKKIKRKQKTIKSQAKPEKTTGTPAIKDFNTLSNQALENILKGV